MQPLGTGTLLQKAFKQHFAILSRICSVLLIFPEGRREDRRATVRHRSFSSLPAVAAHGDSATSL